MKENIRSCLVVFGAFIVMFALGSNFTFGNIMVYMVSYMRKKVEKDLTYAEFIQVSAIFGITQGFVMCFSSFVIQFTGHKPCIILGAILFTSHTFLTKYAIHGSLWKVSLTYGFLPSLGTNLAYLSTTTLAMKRFPKSRATVSGTVTAGLGMGGFFFNQLLTLYLNPMNYSPNGTGKNANSSSLSQSYFKENYFEQPEILNRLPLLMNLLGVIYGVLLILGIFLILDPMSSLSEKQKIVDGSRYVEEEEEESVVQEDEESSYALFKRNLLFILQQREFCSLWLTRFFVVIINRTFLSFYKAFGQTFISNDLFISTAGSIGGVANFLGRFIFGWVMDKTCYKYLMTIASIALILLIAIFYYTKFLGGIWYAFGLCWIFFLLPAVFSTQPAIAQERYGSNLGQLMMGLVGTGDIFNNCLIGLLSGYVLESVGWMGLYNFLTFVAFCALFSLLLFPSNRNNKIPQNNT